MAENTNAAIGRKGKITELIIVTMFICITL